MRTKDIKSWAFHKEVVLVEIAREIKVSKSLITMVISGQRVSGPKAREVIEALKRWGCPAEFLEDSQEAA